MWAIIYCRSGIFCVLRFSRICDFETFREVLNSRINNLDDGGAITIIIFARFLNSLIYPPREIRKKIETLQYINKKISIKSVGFSSGQKYFVLTLIVRSQKSRHFDRL